MVSKAGSNRINALLRAHIQEQGNRERVEGCERAALQPRRTETSDKVLKLSGRSFRRVARL